MYATRSYYEDQRIGRGQVAFMLADRAVSRGPKGFRRRRVAGILRGEKFRMDSHGQHFLVVAAVEHRYLTALGQGQVGPPQA